MKDVERDPGHCLLIIELAEHIHRRLSGFDFQRFEGDRDEVDLTAFRLATIGESCRKLSDDFKAAHPDIPWKKIYGLRNIVSHNYSGILADYVWLAATRDLAVIEAACRTRLP